MAHHFLQPAWDSKLQGLCKLVFLALCNRANQQAQCWPSVARIARDCGISERTVRTHIAHLLRDGFITRQLRGMRSPVYRICLQATQPPATFATPARQMLPPEPGMESVNPIPIALAPKAAPMPNPVPTRTAAVVVVDGVPPELLADFMLVRQSKGHKILTQTELESLRHEAHKAQMTLAEVLRECVLSGWARFKAHWLGEARRQREAIAPVVAAPPVPVPAVAPSPPSATVSKAVLTAFCEHLKAHPVPPPDPYAAARQVIERKRAGENISWARVQHACAVLNLASWKAPCPA